jgi:hypothetical protein
MFKAGSKGDGDRGGGILLVILLGGVLSAIGLGLGALSATERAVAGNHHAGVQLLYAAEALAERVVLDLSDAPEWSSALAGAARSAFFEPGTTVTAPWGEPLDVVQLTATLQQETRTGTSAAPLAWRVYASGSFDALASVPTGLPAFLVAWVGDDPADADGDPAADSNELVVVRLEARAFGGLRRAVQIAVRRLPPVPPGQPTEDPPGVTIVAWREVR